MGKECYVSIEYVIWRTVIHESKMLTSYWISFVFIFAKVAK